jgi:hypothetical protein
MASPSTSVGLVNLALDRLAQANIASITAPTSKIELLCARHYDLEKQSLHREYVWNHARVLALLTASIVVPAFGYTAAYLLPTDCIRILCVGDRINGIIYPPSYYTISGLYLYTTSEITGSTLPIEYVKDETDIAKFDPLFKRLLTLRLAKALSFPLAVSPVKPEQLDRDIAQLELRAAAICGQENPPLRIERSRFTGARRSLNGGGDHTKHYLP